MTVTQHYVPAIDRLHGFASFANLLIDEREWMVENGTEHFLQVGDVLFEEGARAERFFVLLDGEINLVKGAAERRTIVSTLRPGSFTGEVPVLTQTPYVTSAIAVGACRLLLVEQDAFHVLLATCPPFRTLVFETLARRLQESEASMRQREKMASLGTLAAGLAHELNNPAAAAQRAAEEGRDLMHSQLTMFQALLQHDLSDGQWCLLSDLVKVGWQHSAEISSIDSLALSEQEDSIMDWLDEFDIDESWMMAPTFAAGGLDVERLQPVVSVFPAAALQAAFGWLDATLGLNSMLDTVEHSTTRISGLVQAVKSYSYMDRTPLQEIDIHDGIEDTLTMLGHKLKQGSITIRREYDASLPDISAYGNELNQVWTNLIDNAIDALDGQGTITIRTERSGEFVKVEIADDGSGISAETQSRIFEPFFTTKGIGKGTGLGLDIAYRIVSQRHHGDIKVTSTPGDTRFSIWLPVQRAVTSPT